MLIFCEKKYVEDVILTRKDYKFNFKQQVKLLVAYLFHIGKDESQVRDDLDRLLPEMIEGYNDVLYYGFREGIIKQARREPLRVCDEVAIFKEELEMLRGLDKNKQKLAFIVLLIYKIYSGNPPRYSFNEAHMVAQTTYKKYNFEILHQLYKEKLVDYFKGRAIPTFYKDNGETVFKAYSFEDGVKKLQGYFSNKKIITCQRCGCEIVESFNNKKYCENCAKLVKREQNKEWARNRKIEKSQNP